MGGRRGRGGHSSTDCTPGGSASHSLQLSSANLSGGNCVKLLNHLESKKYADVQIDCEINQQYGDDEK